MIKYLLFGFILSALSGTLAQLCPPEEVMDPCTCDEEYSTIREKLIYCGNDRLTDLKEMFDRISPLIPEDVIFDRLYVVGTRITELPANTIGTMKFIKIAINTNTQLKYISPDAFNATLTVTTDLNLSGNHYLYYPPNDPNDIYRLVNKFTNVQEVSIEGMQEIRRIPDLAFGPLQNLSMIRHAPSTLLSIGSKPYSQVPNLNRLRLSYCDISLNELANDTFEGIGSDAEVDLEHNPFSRLPEHIFKPLLDNARSVRVGGQDCVWFCTDIRLDCDQESAWLCQNVPFYRPKLHGFFCQIGSGHRDIWDYCAAINNGN